jgi:hypothetical protein
VSLNRNIKMDTEKSLSGLCYNHGIEKENDAIVDKACSEKLCLGN